MERRVFFIGPMSDAMGDADVLPRVREHFAQTLIERYGFARTGVDPKTATVVLTRIVDSAPEEIHLSIPQSAHLTGDIPTDVFHQIDTADLVVADLSDNRPPVIYELALADALGIQVLIVRSRLVEERAQSPARFYELHRRFFELDLSGQTSRGPDFDDVIGKWLHQQLTTSNPIQSFYGAPLLDISAAAGIAVGFFNNFARPLLDGAMLEDTSDSSKNRSPVGLLVLRTDRLTGEYIDDVTEKLGSELDKAFEGEVVRGKDKTLLVTTRDRSRRTPMFVVRDWIIDVPRTMLSLKHSKRLARFKNLDGHAAQSAERIEQALIHRFVENVMASFQEALSTEVTLGKLQFGSIAEIIETLRSQPRAARP